MSDTEFRSSRSRFASRPPAVQPSETTAAPSSQPPAQEAAPPPSLAWEVEIGEAPAIGTYAGPHHGPYHGRTVWLTADGKTPVEAQWHVTRAFDRATCRWGWAGYWSVPNTGRRLDIEPLAWAKYE